MGSFCVVSTILCSISSCMTIIACLIGSLWLLPYVQNLESGTCTADSCTVTPVTCGGSSNTVYTCWDSVVYFHIGSTHAVDASQQYSYANAAEQTCATYYAGYNFTCYWDASDMSGTLSISTLSYYVAAAVLFSIAICCACSLWIAFCVYIDRNYDECECPSCECPNCSFNCPQPRCPKLRCYGCAEEGSKEEKGGEKEIEKKEGGDIRSISSNDLEHDRSTNLKRTQCNICFDRKRACVILPWGHTEICITCSLDILKSENKLCPFCRTPIKNIIRTF